MPNQLKSENLKVEMKWDDRETLDNRIREQVIHALGKPTDLRNVQVRKVGKDRYRVNVIVGDNAGSVRVANSYFLEIDGDGSLIAATPKITKQY
jgi:hypothetical protein